jgi:hypothetical protein
MAPTRRFERPRGMRRLAALALVALATTGCFGSSSDRAPSSDSDLAAPWPKTMMTISYTVDTCPPGVHSMVLPVGNSRPQALRELTCSPYGGDYTDPAAACRALADVVKQLAAKDYVCGCAINPPHALAKAVGIYCGKRRTIPLDGCSLCNLRLGADIEVLLPGATRH